MNVVGKWKRRVEEIGLSFNLLLFQTLLSRRPLLLVLLRWLIGRTPPSIFEYPRINGFYTPKQAQSICEKDIQCGGFTFKGSKKIMHTVPEVYFFHFINESSSYLTTEIRYPHWTTYIIASRDHIVVSGSYSSYDDTNWHRMSRYEGFRWCIYFN